MCIRDRKRTYDLHRRFAGIFCALGMCMALAVLLAYLKAADTRQNASFALRLSKLAPQQREKKAAPAPKARPKAPQEGFFADRPDIPVDKIFGKEEDK